jgi:hypothetical protein
MDTQENPGRTQSPTLFDLAAAIDEATSDPIEAVVVLSHLIASGRVRWVGLRDAPLV